MIRTFLAALMFAKAATAVGWYFESTTMFSKAHWYSIANVVAWTAVGFGVWRATEWGRRGCMFVGLALCGWFLVEQVQAMQVHGGRDPFPVIFYATTAFFFAILVLPYAALAIYGVLPSTLREFARARVARKLMSS